MKTFTNILLLLLVAVSAMAQTAEIKPVPRFSRDDAAWLASFSAFATTQVLDIHSSNGKRELNPMFRASDGMFDTNRAVLIKSATVGGVFASQYFINKKYPSMKKYSTLMNIGLTVGYVFVLRHNYSIDRVPGIR